ncbi:MAG: DUF1573 domain-containing protein [Pirellulales bacterium]
MKVSNSMSSKRNQHVSTGLASTGGLATTGLWTQRMNCFRRAGFCVVILSLLSTLLSTTLLISQAGAQEWADKMFGKLSHDFGTVARGADTVYRFEVTNLYKQTMHITGVRSSCGCTTPTVENATIKTHEKAYIVAKFNTRTFVGRHGATLTVSLDAPFRAEVQVRIQGNIRSDVVFSPGAIQFGSVDQGSTQEQQVEVNYAGRNNWEILDITNDNDHFEVELKETKRVEGRVSYSLLVRLKDNLSPGYVNDQLTVITNDRRSENQRIPLFVEGKVTPEISVTPATLVLGEVKQGEEISKRLIVRGKKPFKIVEIGCDDDCFDFKMDEKAKLVHLVNLTYRASDQVGKLSQPVQIKTDRGDNRSATCTVSVSVVPGDSVVQEDSAVQQTQAISQSQDEGSANTP